MDEFTRLLGSGTFYCRPSIADWTRSETDIGVTFPEDFKRVVSQTGRGYFGRECCLRNPAWENFPLTREALVDERHDLREFRDFQKLLLYPAARGGIIIGDVVTRVGIVFWPSSGQLAICDYETAELTEIPRPLDQFLCNLYLRRYDQHIFKELGMCLWRSPAIPFFDPF